MTDCIREAFEKEFGKYPDEDDKLMYKEAWTSWQAAWKQSRREALDAVLRGLRSEEQTQQMRAVIASVECIRAVAEEEGK